MHRMKNIGVWNWMIWHTPFFSFFEIDYFLFTAVLGSQQNWEEGAEISHQPPYPLTCIVSPVINSVFVTINESALIHHYCPKSTVSIRVQSWCWTFHGFGQIDNDMCPSLQHHTEYFHCPMILCAPPIHPSLLLAPAHHSSFSASVVCLFQNVI